MTLVRGLALGLLSSLALPAIQVAEQTVGPASEPGTIYTLSPTGLHLATVSAQGSRFVVTVDGTAGPPFDEILPVAGALELGVAPATLQPAVAYRWRGPVAFSPDGRRHAYVGRLGKDLVVMLDGKEIYRTPHSLGRDQPPVYALSFTPNSQHLFFYRTTTDTMFSNQLMLDGKPATPAFAGNPIPFFSADGRRWGLLAAKPTAPHDPFLIIDGKDAGYVGLRPRFTPDGKRVVSIRSADATGRQRSVLVDGKPALTVPALHQDDYVLSARGDIAAIGIMDGGKRQLFINGRPAPGGEHAWSVTFSPDGKRWAAQCSDHPMHWVVVDGKAHQHYHRVSNVAFTPDSSKCVYLAESPTKKFVVIDGQEDAGAQHISTPPFFAERGDRVAYVAKVQPGHGGQQATLNHAPLRVAHGITRFTLSPDGSRHAFTAAQDALSTQLIIDGEVVGTGFAQGDQVLFSADSRQVAAIARPPGGSNQALYLNGNYIASNELKADALLAFTPDGRHLLSMARGSAPRGAVGNLETYHLNGQPVAQFAARGVQWANPPTERRAWELQSDGTIVLLGVEPTSDQSYGVMKRVTVAPEKTGDLSTWVSDLTTARERALAEAEEAKARAEAARLAELAARKQAQEDAAAARKQAREEAEAARKKAQADAAAARAKAKAEADAARAKKP
jgi:WD40 repeat protein